MRIHRLRRGGDGGSGGGLEPHAAGFGYSQNQRGGVLGPTCKVIFFEPLNQIFSFHFPDLT